MGSLIMWWMCKRWICTSESCKSYFHIATAQTIWGEIDLPKKKMGMQRSNSLKDWKNNRIFNWMSTIHSPESLSVPPVHGPREWSRWTSPIRINGLCKLWCPKNVAKHNYIMWNEWKCIVSSNPMVQEECLGKLLVPKLSVPQNWSVKFYCSTNHFLNVLENCSTCAYIKCCKYPCANKLNGCRLSKNDLLQMWPQDYYSVEMRKRLATEYISR